MQHLTPALSIAMITALIISSCSLTERLVPTHRVDKTSDTTETASTRLCFQNEYVFAEDPSQRDVLSLTINIKADHVDGEYHWLPAFKDKRLGEFEGTIDGQSVTAQYQYSQEGLSDVATILIRLEPEQAIVEGKNPELGFDATLAKANC